ncbi:MAG: 3-deoxy-D-manno-octulosonic acid transferase [Candidatus Auribacterota bacterium]
MHGLKILFFQLVYNICGILFLIAASPYFIVKILITEKYRKGFIQRSGFMPSELTARIAGRKLIWVHAVSVGEAQTAFPVIERLKLEYPEYHILLTTTTATGQNVARSRTAGDETVTVMYFPLDFRHIFRRIFKKFDIRLILIMETEIWPNFLIEAYHRNVPAVLVNGRISQSSYKGYRRLRPLFLASTEAIKMFCMQERADAERLILLGIDPSRVVVTQNLKYEASLKTPVKTEILDKIRINAQWSRKEQVLIAGSTHRGEEQIVAGVYKSLKENIRELKLILAPRHPERLAEVEKILQNSGIDFVRKTSLDAGEPQNGRIDVILLDTMGELRHIYDLASVVFVGKSMVPGGGQNILEPAALEKPVVFGPHMDNFRLIADSFVAQSAGFVANTPDELESVLKKLFLNRTLRISVGQKGKYLVSCINGALDKTFESISAVMR